jgi:hypothetical protein
MPRKANVGLLACALLLGLWGCDGGGKITVNSSDASSDSSVGSEGDGGRAVGTADGGVRGGTDAEDDARGDAATPLGDAATDAAAEGGGDSGTEGADGGNDTGVGANAEGGSDAGSDTAAEGRSDAGSDGTTGGSDALASFTVGGTVAGLAPGDVLTLDDDGGDVTFVSTNGTFAFSAPVMAGATYAVTLAGNPATPVAQSCAVTNGAGTVGAGNVTNVEVTCTTNAYPFTLDISGLVGANPFTLTNTVAGGLCSSGCSMASGTLVPANGTGALGPSPHTELSGTAFAFVVSTQPSAPVQTCAVSASQASPVTNAPVTINVSCTANPVYIGGTIAGLTGSVSLLDTGASGGSRTFTGTGSAVTYGEDPSNTPAGWTPPAGSTYAVTTVAGAACAPADVCYVDNAAGTANQTCTVANATGTADVDVTNVNVTCATNSFPVGGFVQGLALGNALHLDSGQAVGDQCLGPSPCAAPGVVLDGVWQFANPIPSGTTFGITFQPATNEVLSANGQVVRLGGTGAPQQCGLSNENPTLPSNTVGNGPIAASSAAAAMTNGINITCQTAYLVEGTQSSAGAIGLNGTLVLKNTVNGGALGTDTLTLTNAGDIVFPDGLAPGDTYSVSVASAPAGQTCTVVNGSGTMGTMNVTNVFVECGAAGTSCTTDAECLSGLCQAVAGASRCQRVILGGQCGGDNDCYSGNCSQPIGNGSCLPPVGSPVGIGGSCGGNGDCRSGVCVVVADDTGGQTTCRGACAAPAPSTSNSQGLYTQTTTAFCATGVACAADRDCGSDVCAAGFCSYHGGCLGGACGPYSTCVASGCSPTEHALGQACASGVYEGSDCVTGLCSYTTNVCIAEPCAATLAQCGTGTPCGANSECRSGTCVASTHLCQ